jgi:hypothetical protein
MPQGLKAGIFCGLNIRAEQASEKLIRAVGRGFIPGTKPIKSMRALAPEVRFPGISIETRPFSAACEALTCRRPSLPLSVSRDSGIRDQSRAGEAGLANMG